MLSSNRCMMKLESYQLDQPDSRPSTYNVLAIWTKMALTVALHVSWSQAASTEEGLTWWISFSSDCESQLCFFAFVIKFFVFESKGSLFNFNNWFIFRWYRFMTIGGFINTQPSIGEVTHMISGSVQGFISNCRYVIKFHCIRLKRTNMVIVIDQKELFLWNLCCYMNWWLWRSEVQVRAWNEI